MEKIYTSCVAAFYCIVSFLLGLFTKVKNNWLGKPAILLLLFAFSSAAFNDAHADVTITTSPVTAGGVNQGSNNNLIYVAQVAVTTNPVVVNNIQFTLGGTHDGSDLSTVLAYYNSSSPDFAGSSFLGSAVAGFAAPHTYSINVSRSITAGSTGYFIIVANVNSGATDNNTIKINGATNPVVFGFTTSPVVTNNQSDLAGLQTIQAADITVTTSPVTAAGINQGSNNNIIYIAQVAVATNPADVSNVQFTLSGTHDANDLSTVLVYFNSSSPSFAGSSFLGSALASFAAPHTYSINLSRNLPAGSTGYFIIVTNVNSGATDNNTVKISGATNPVIFGFATSPNITNTQTDAAGTQTIHGADITVTTSPVTAAGINQGSNNNIIYIAQVAVATNPADVNNVQFTLSGTHDANDLSTVLVYFNSSSPSFAGSSFLGSALASFAAPHTYSINLSRNLPAGSTGYFIIVANVNSGATDNNTVKINGATNPVIFGFATSPNITNTQTDAAGTQTIQASDITLNTSPTASSPFPNGSNNNIVYIAQMSVATMPVLINNIQFTLSGTHDADDLTTVNVYFNGSAPAFAGSSFLGSAVTSFAGPHTYSINISRNMDAGTTGYYVIIVNVDPLATLGNTVTINGAANPVVFGFATSPNITNNQVNNAGLHTLPVTFISVNAQTAAAGVAITWKTANELNIEKYIIERSADGTSFRAIGETMAIGGSNSIEYQFTDRAAFAGKNFYRIRAVNLDGRTELSPTVTFNIDGGTAGISIYPNPVVKNQLLTLSLQNIPRGNYSVRIQNAQGQLLQQQTIVQENGNSVQTIVLANTAAGIYTIEVSNHHQRFVKRFMTK